MSERTEVVERAVEEIERELQQRLDVHQRIVITVVLERLADEVLVRKREWWD